MRWLFVFLWVAMAASPVTSAETATRLESARVLRAKLAANGRAEASVTHSLTDDLGGGAPRPARLALETPDRVRLDFGDGEVLTMRNDGGEWLQPATQQMLVLPADQLEVAARLWRVLLGGGGPEWRETRTAPRTFTITPVPGLGGEAAPFTSLTVVLAPDGLPRSVTAANGNQTLALRFRTWRFTPPKGASAFRLTAPPGVTVVPMQ